MLLYEVLDYYRRWRLGTDLKFLILVFGLGIASAFLVWVIGLFLMRIVGLGYWVSIILAIPAYAIYASLEAFFTYYRIRLYIAPF